MKRIIPLVLSLIVLGCSSVEIVDNWKNPDIAVFKSSKVLIIGMTANTEARRQFEQQLKQAYELRGIEGVMSLDVFEPDFTLEKQSKEAINRIEAILLANNFDAVLFTKVIGVEDKIAYRNNYDSYNETHISFKDDYLKYQDVYYNPDYYDEYSIYHSETSLYCLCPTKDRELIWKGYIDITDPYSVAETVNDYVKLVTIVLEEQNLMAPKSYNEKITEDAIQ
ncbi:hypothetical protein CLV33_102301 [Jejuia pallidilutea]|uniref:Cardiolipin synthetase n=1 Tax=Jejuia pallidilutea TaxID=504487 RepID=A0A362X9M2_9FLAO|nr:hypothetical protein [Jejuia pallidilutea]PQV50439.1 hypothetical protein CLV33_102301 [Jejuia pallidilutea]